MKYSDMGKSRTAKQAHIWHESTDAATLTIDGARLTVQFVGTGLYNKEVFRWSVEIGKISYQGSAESLEQGKRLAMNQYKQHVKLSSTKSNT